MGTTITICDAEDETQEAPQAGKIDKKNKRECCCEKKLDEKAVKQREEFQAEINRLSKPGANYIFTQATFYRIPIDLTGWAERFQKFGVTCHATGADNPLHVIIILTAKSDNYWLTEFNSSGIKLKYFGNKDEVAAMLQIRGYIKMSNVYGQTDNDEKDQYIQCQTCDKIEQPIKPHNKTFGNCQKLAEWFQTQNQKKYNSLQKNCIDYAIELAQEIEMHKYNIWKLKGPVMFARDAAEIVERAAPFGASLAMVAHDMSNN